jgi:hypothetical protein
MPPDTREPEVTVTPATGGGLARVLLTIELTDTLAALSTPPVHQALSERQRSRPNLDIAQVRDVEVRAPVDARGAADPNVYTRIGLALESAEPGQPARFVLSMYDAKGLPPSNPESRGRGLGPARFIQLDSSGIRAWLGANDAGLLGKVIAQLFKNLEEGGYGPKGRRATALSAQHEQQRATE